MTLTAIDIVLALLALGAAIAAVVFWQRGAPDAARIDAERDAMTREAAGLRTERDQLRQRAEAAERDLAAERAKASERDAAMARREAESEQRFQAMADATLRKSQQQFIELADETLKKHKEGAQGELGAMLKPMQETFGQFREKIEQIEKVRSEDRAKLDQQLREVGESTRLTREATGKLQTALTSTKGGGRWGEETLRNVLEIAGLSPYADFTEQTSTTTESGRIRPDVTVRLPGGRHLVIDSKVSLVDYLAAADETDPARANRRLAAHAASVRSHVSALGRKDYWKDIPDTVDFVAMFIPGENFYAAVLEHDRDIFDFAAKNNVIIVTPSTLIALAKSVAYGWRQEQMAKNAEQAASLGQELYERLTKMVEHMARVGGGLSAAARSYNEMVGSFEARVLPAARKFEELHMAGSGKPIEEPPKLEIAPRQLTFLDAPEMPAAAAGGKRK